MFDSLTLRRQELDELSITRRAGTAGDNAIRAVDGHVHSLAMSPAWDLRPDTVGVRREPTTRAGWARLGRHGAVVTTPWWGGHAGRDIHRFRRRKQSRRDNPSSSRLPVGWGVVLRGSRAARSGIRFARRRFMIILTSTRRSTHRRAGHVARRVGTSVIVSAVASCGSSG